MDVHPHKHSVSAAALCGTVLVCLCARTFVCLRTCLARIFYCNNCSWAVLYMLMHECTQTQTHTGAQTRLHAQHVVCMLIELCAGSYNPWNSLQMNIKPVCVAFKTIQLRRQSAWFKQNLTQSCSAANLSFFVLCRKSYLYSEFLPCWQQNLAGFAQESVVICVGITRPVSINWHSRTLNPYSPLPRSQMNYLCTVVVFEFRVDKFGKVVGSVLHLLSF